jgi:hypothetical protein
MLRHDVRAELNVPVRLIYVREDGRTCIGHDRPSSLMSRLPHAKLAAAAQKQDEKLAALVERIRAA